MKLARVAASLGLSMAMFVPGCGGAPVREAAPGARPALASDEGGLRYAMDHLERQLQASPLLVRDAALNAYLRDLVCRLAASYCGDIRVYVIDVPAFNASMAPNGMMQVWTGLLLRVEDEAELAYVIGHEIGHYRARHMLSQWLRLKRTENFVAAFQVLTLGFGAGLVGSLASLAGSAQVLAFSRDQEREADVVGFQTLLNHGYDPSAAPRLYAALLDEEHAREGKKPSAIFATHPPTEERLDNLRALAHDAPAMTARDDGSARLRAVVAPLRAAWLRGELSRRHDGQSLVLLERLRADEPVATRGEILFTLAELYRRRARADDLARAEALYREALTTRNAPIATHRELGMLLRASGARAEAASELRRYLQADPDASDRAAIDHYLRELERP